MSKENTKHDDMLFEMLKECKTLPNFLDAIFGFLSRRTDFYHIANEPNSAVGLPEGFAEKIAQHAFFKWKSGTNNLETVCKPEDIPAVSEELVISDEVMQEIPCAAKESKNQHIASKVSKNSEHRFSKSDYYNGAAYDNYCWSQTITDVDVIVKLPEKIGRKDLEVDILTNKITVKLKDGNVLLSGEFCQKCKANDVIWSADNGKLNIHLEKGKEMWWNCLLKSEPQLDISKIDCSRPFEELPDDAQAKIEELQWNQERKRLGLPTSDEIAMHKTLEKAWSAEGSPFSGPFDPSKVQFS
ncbi:unnamed protein product [Callosobruchus maculatus]|uniref:Nuclear migration protein nudC n=1 Tax=Callosobruchus maculatus TaxID=64391 RepID=A0A653CID9_CALMS|nr:unnamed protein product [Callosobruchus maculatus]